MVISVLDESAACVIYPEDHNLKFTAVKISNLKGSNLKRIPIYLSMKPVTITMRKTEDIHDHQFRPHTFK
jgi:hypothetical protein